MALLARMAGQKLPMVLGARAKRFGGRLELTERQERQLVFIRDLHSRFAGVWPNGKPRGNGQGDYRATETELKRLWEVGEWLVRVHCQNQNQPEKPTPFARDEGRMWRSAPMPDGSYIEVCQKVRSGEI